MPPLKRKAAPVKKKTVRMEEAPAIAPEEAPPVQQEEEDERPPPPISVTNQRVKLKKLWVDKAAVLIMEDKAVFVHTALRRRSHA